MVFNRFQSFLTTDHIFINWIRNYKYLSGKILSRYSMKLQSMLAIAFTLVVFAEAYNFNHDMGAKLDGRIIHVESLRYRGHWLKSSFHNGGKWIAVYGLAQRDTYYTQWSQFKAWAQWKIYCTSQSMDVCRFESMRYRGHYFDSSHTGGLGVARYGNGWSRFRILAPNAEDYYVTILSTENHSSASSKKTLTVEEGVIDSTTTENTITTSVSVEVQKAFVTASASVTHEWKQTESKTFEKRTSFTYEVPIPARSKIEVKQLTGEYGPFRIKVNKFIIKETKLDGRKRGLIEEFDGYLIDY
uniref:Putative cnidarian restricted protein n=1 Tax=Clytia hemisphaerica TaxID=252671 RepID=A0A069DMS6_9CNID